MPDVARAVLAGDLRFNMINPDCAYGARGDVLHRHRNAARDVERLACRVWRLERNPARTRDVVNADKVALLEPILIDERLPAVQDTRGKIAQHARVRIR